MKINFNRTDLAHDKTKKLINLYKENNIEISTIKNKQNKYHLIKFNYLNNELKTILKKELNFFLNKIKNKKHILIIGLGNNNYTSDSIGPKVLKNINVNAHLLNMGASSNIKVSALEPGVLGQTGIETSLIISSIVKEINPDLLIIIDSFVTNNINNLEKSIIITNEGITPGSGVATINNKINQKSIGKPVIVIGIPTALEIEINKQKLLVSSNIIDKYIYNLSKIIGEVINEVLYFS